MQLFFLISDQRSSSKITQTQSWLTLSQPNQKCKVDHRRDLWVEASRKYFELIRFSTDIQTLRMKWEDFRCIFISVVYGMKSWNPDISFFTFIIEEAEWVGLPGNGFWFTSCLRVGAVLMWVGCAGGGEEPEINVIYKKWVKQYAKDSSWKFSELTKWN